MLGFVLEKGLVGDGIMTTIRGFMLVTLFLASTCLSAHQQAGENLSISGVIDDDLYLAGGQVDLYATVEGDVVVAGGKLNLEGNVQADVIAAGGDLELRGTVADDARLAGGNIRVLAAVGDDLLVAGGRIQLGSMAEVGGAAWLSGGEYFSRWQGRPGSACQWWQGNYKRHDRGQC